METEHFIPLPILNQHDEDTRTLEPLYQKLATTRGKEYWRSLDELADTPEFRKFVETEFPSKHELWMDPISRRDFLKIMGAGIAMMFFTGCKKPLQMIFPYNENPEGQIPGKPLFYATALSLGGYMQGVLVENHEGRPTKVEGNAEHPDSLGATDIFMQAAILGLYDPDRSQTVMNKGIISGWDTFLSDLRQALDEQKDSQGAGIRILTEMVSSPSLEKQIRNFLKRFPKAKWHQYEPTARANAMAGSRLAFGEVLETQLRLEKAEVILSLDADFLATGPGHLRLARAFAEGRNLTEGNRRMSRLYMVEPGPTITGASADHRLPMRAGDIENFTRRLAHELGVDGGSGQYAGSAESRRWISAVAKDLQAHRGRSVVIAGDGQPPVVHALSHAINAALGNVGETVLYTDSDFISPNDTTETFKELVDDMTNKRVDLLVMLGGNPVYDAPADVPFKKSLDQVKTRVRLGLYEDETSSLSHWHIPQAHPLESWNDGRASDGTLSIAQPLIEPLYGGKTTHEMLSALTDDSPRNAHDIIKDYWKSAARALSFDTFWKTTLHDGVMANSAFATRQPSLRSGFAGEAPRRQAPASKSFLSPTPQSWTAAGPTMAGFRNSRSR